MSNNAEINSINVNYKLKFIICGCEWKSYALSSHRTASESSFLSQGSDYSCKSFNESFGP